MLRFSTLLLACALPFSLYAEVNEFQIILSGRDAGTQTVDYQANGKATLFFEFNDRGRGDKITSLIQLNESGLPIRMDNEGNDYMKAPVEEHFRLEDQTAHWQTKSGQGKQQLNEPGFYLPLNGTPEIAGVLARALLQAPNQTLRMVPAGQASIREMTRKSVTLAGEEKQILLYFIEGLGFSPETIWLESDGSSFASVSPWFSILPAAANADELIPELLDAEREMLDRYSAELASNLGRHPSADVLIRHARLYDPRDLSVKDDMAVLISGQRISAVDKDAVLLESLKTSAAEFQTLDAEGRFLMPGLWDSHQHFGDTTGLMDIATGVTSARDLANDSESMLARKNRFDEGSEIGPRVFLGGFMDGPGPLAGPTKVLVDSAQEADEWVEWYAQRGYRQIKVYSSLKPSLVSAIARSAHRHGLRLSGHVPAFMSAEEFIQAGADEIQHLNMLFLNFLTDIAPDTRDMTRFTAVAEFAKDIDPNQQRVKDLIQLMQERHTTLDPTVTIFEGMFSGKPNDPPPGMASYLKRVPPEVARNWLSGALPIPEGQEAAYQAAFPAMLTLLKAVYDAGIPIVAGTDAMPGFALYRELALYVQAGLTPAEALRTATLTPAQVMGVDHSLGSPAPGQYADLILVDGQPDQNIGDIERVQLVIKNGVFYQATQLQKSLGIEAIVEPLQDEWLN